MKKEGSEVFTEVSGERRNQGYSDCEKEKQVVSTFMCWAPSVTKKERSISCIQDMLGSAVEGVA